MAQVGEITYLRQDGPGQPFPTRPNTSEVPAGFAWWGLFDQPDSGTGLEEEDLVLNISGSAWQ